MKRPGWVTAIGITAIVVACMDLMASAYSLLMPTWTRLWKDWFTRWELAMGEMPGFPRMGFLTRMWEMPPWLTSWIVMLGALGMLAAGFCLYAAIMLLQMKVTAIRLFYWASGLVIALSVIQGGLAMFSGSFVAMSLLFGNMVRAVLFAVLLLVVATSDKSPFASARERGSTSPS